MQSAGTGVYYQAIPAVGPDGKNVMTLVPVRKVNGQFFRTQAPFRNDCQFGVPPHFSAFPHAGFQTVRQGTDGSFVLQTPPTNSTFLTAVRGPHQTVNAVFLNTRPQVPIPVVRHIMTQNVPLPPPNQPPMIVLKRPQPPVAVKPPVHPDGHYLQVPADATIGTLPVSALPLSIQNQIYSSSGVSSSSAKDPLTIRYVSPVSSVKIDQQSPCHSNVGEGAHSPAPGSVPYQRWSSPTKGVVQEPRAPYLIPVSSTNMSAEILKIVQQMETERRNQKTTFPISQQEKVTPGNDNALVLCEGKVYFVAKKNAELIKEVVTNLGGGESVTPSSTSSVGSNAKTSSKELSDIIDLCDDDEDEVTSSCPVSEEVRKEEQQDDDDANVIFVSYIPPKSSEPETDRNSGPTQTNTVASETKGSSMETQPQCVKKEDVPTAGVKDRTDRTDLDGYSMKAEPEAPPSQPSHSEMLSNGGDVPRKTPPASDAELRQTFGIVHDLKVSLQRIKESKEVSTHAEKQFIDKRTLEGIRKLLCGSKLENRIRSLIQKRVPSPKHEGSSLQPTEVKRPKLDPGGDGTASVVTCERSGSSPESTEEPSTTSSPPSSTFQEPVHTPDAKHPEKIPRHHSESPNTSDSQPRSDHVMWNSATEPTDVKSSSESQSTAACWSPAPVEPCSSLKNLRSDTPYKVEVEALPLMGRYSTTETYKLPSELFSSVVLDPEEIKRQERIKRLKDTLREKEAALERLRSGI